MVSGEMSHFLFAQKFRQLGDVHRGAPRLVFAEQLGRRSPAGLLLEVDIRLAATIPNNEAGGDLLD